jgi:hypothetical protein
MITRTPPPPAAIKPGFVPADRRTTEAPEKKVVKCRPESPASSNSDELNDLLQKVAETQSKRIATSRQSGRRTRPSNARRIIVQAAACLICVVAVSMLVSFMLNTRGNTTASVAAPERIDAEFQSQLRADSAAHADAPPSAFRFVPVSALTAPEEGKPLRVHCLLRAELDPFTFALWQRKGMLSNAEFSKPFLPLVTIKDRESLELLFDWHVESVAVSNNP